MWEERLIEPAIPRLAAQGDKHLTTYPPSETVVKMEAPIKTHEISSGVRSTSNHSTVKKTELLVPLVSQEVD